MSLFGRMLKCVRLVDLRHHAAFGGYYRDHFMTILSRISIVCNVNNVNSNHGDPVIVHLCLCCLCDFSLLRFEKRCPVGGMFILPLCSHFVDRIIVCTSFGLFILGYFINMHYGHIASDKGASICERSLLSFVIRVLIVHTKRTFQSAI